MAINARQKFLDIQRRSLLGRLEQLMSRLDDPGLTPEKLEQLKAEVQECRRRFEELGFAQAGPDRPDPET